MTERDDSNTAHRGFRLLAPRMLTSLYLPRRKAFIAVPLGVAASATAILWTSAETWPAGVLLAFALAWASLIDIDRFVLPDSITLGLVIVGLASAAFLGNDALIDRTIGAAAGCLSLALVAHAYRLARNREGLGLGDAKLFAAAGAWLGWAALPQVMIVAAMAALVVVAVRLFGGHKLSMERRIPFGLFISLGIWAMWLFRQPFGVTL
jgi:leader peptidase (prepilin peptidase) / N-methyltransferase